MTRRNGTKVLTLAVVAMAVFAGPAQVGALEGELGILTPGTLAGNNPATGAPWADGDNYRFAFFTSEARTAESNDIEIYNAWAQDLANASAVYDIGADDGATWKVIGSTDEVDARDNTSTNPTVESGHAIFLLDGSTVVANDYADLWDGEIQNIINITEQGDVLTWWPWTGTYWDGTAAPGHPTSFAALGGGGQIHQGRSDVVTEWIWRMWTGDPPDLEHNMYALSDPLVIVTTGMTWDGGVGNWAAENWDDGSAPPLVGPGPDMAMIIDVADSVVTVAADCVSGGTGPAGSVTVGENHPASLIVNDTITLEVTEAVTVGSSGTLQVDGTLAAGSLTTDSGSTLSGNGTVSAATMANGTIAPGDSAGMLSFQGELELGATAVYQCEIAEWDSPGGLPPQPPLPDPPMDPSINDRLHAAAGEINLDGTLMLKALAKLHPRVIDPVHGVEVEWYGDQQRVIASTVGESVVGWTFANVPDPQPEDWSNILTGTPEWSQGHIGRGVFLTRQNDGGQGDVPGVSYGNNATKLHLFQACDGDTNGDRTLGGRDIQNIQSFALFGITEDPGPGFVWPPDWSQGDFDGDGLVTGLDISAILATGLWPTEGYAAIEPGTPLDGVVDLLLYPEDVTLEDGTVIPAGTVMIDPDGLVLNGYVLRSEAGVFTGAPAQQLNWFFVEDTDRQISGNMGATISALRDLGPVIGPEWTIINPLGKQEVDPLDDLTFTYTVVGTPGTFVGNLIIVPEPSTLVMLLGSGALGLLRLILRRRRPR